MTARQKDRVFAVLFAYKNLTFGYKILTSSKRKPNIGGVK